MIDFPSPFMLSVTVLAAFHPSAIVVLAESVGVIAGFHVTLAPNQGEIVIGKFHVIALPHAIVLQE
jgi:hypothetical protein